MVVAAPFFCCYFVLALIIDFAGLVFLTLFVSAWHLAWGHSAR